MTLKNYLWVMSVLTIVCWGIFAFVVNMVDPFSTNWLGYLLFYASLAASLIGTISIFGFLLRYSFAKEKAIFNLVKISFRQSFILSLFIISFLILKSFDLFSWINLILLIILFTFLEISMSLKKKIKK
ncbi:MAG: hypothetical protein PF488_03010 [Patescibacteria group bacterium]|jgi:hypothetical protein|nr:hypothetical protein [Patescibacteria group bacterium]